VRDTEFITSLSTAMIKKCEQSFCEHTSLYESFKMDGHESDLSLPSPLKPKGLSITFKPDLSSSKLSREVFKALSTAPPGSVVHLPQRPISIPSIVIKNPIKVKGVPGSIL